MNFNITIHAGESFGPESIWQALQYCGAHRIGHGTRLIEDIVVYEGKVIKLGPLAQYVLDHRIPIEVCLSSNVHTGAAPSMESTPSRSSGPGLPRDAQHRQPPDEPHDDDRRVRARGRDFGCDLDDLETLSINGMKSAFAHYPVRCDYIYDRIKSGYAALREGRWEGLAAEAMSETPYLRDPASYHGRVEMRPFESEALRGNPAGDPARARGAGLPAPGLGPRRAQVPGRVRARRVHQPRPQVPRQRSLAARGRARLRPPRGEPARRRRRSWSCPTPSRTWAGSQYLNSSFLGGYADYVAEELVAFVDENYPTLPGRRAVCGKSSGGFGALRPGPAPSRDLRRAGGSISGDCCFDVLFPGELLACLRGLIPWEGDPARFLEDFRLAPNLGGDRHAVILTLAMSACFSPNPDAPLGFDLPMDLSTGERIQPVWERWLAFDPLVDVERRADALRGLELLHLECGLRDEFHLQWGLRRLVRRLRELDVPCEHVEHPGGHGGIDDRYQEVLPALIEAVT